MNSSSPKKRDQNAPICLSHPPFEIEFICINPECKNRLQCIKCREIHLKKLTCKESDIQSINSWFQSFFQCNADKNNNRRKYATVKSLEEFKKTISNQKNLIIQIEKDIKKCLLELVDRIVKEIKKVSDKIIGVLDGQSKKNEEKFDELFLKFNEINRRHPQYLIEQLKGEFESHKKIEKIIEDLIQQQSSLISGLEYATELEALQLEIQKNITGIRNEVTPFDSRVFYSSMESTYVNFVNEMQLLLENLYIDTSRKGSDETYVGIIQKLKRSMTPSSCDSPPKIIKTKSELKYKKGSFDKINNLFNPTNFKLISPRGLLSMNKNFKFPNEKQGKLLAKNFKRNSKKEFEEENFSGGFEEETTFKEFDKYHLCQIIDDILLCMSDTKKVLFFDIGNNFSLVLESDFKETEILDVSAVGCLKLLNLKTRPIKEKIINAQNENYENLLVLGGNDENLNLEICDLMKNEVLCSFPEAHQEAISTIEILEFTVSENYFKSNLATGSLDNNIKIWSFEIISSKETNIKNAAILPIKIFNFHSQSINALKLLKYNEQNMLISVSRDKNISVWDWKSSAETPCFSIANAHSDTINDVIYLGKTSFATSSGDKYVKIWDVNAKKEIKTLKNKNGVDKLKELSFYRLAAVSNSLKLREFVICIWNWRDESLICTLTGHKSKISNISYSAKSGKIVSCDKDRFLKVWKNLTY